MFVSGESWWRVGGEWKVVAVRGVLVTGAVRRLKSDIDTQSEHIHSRLLRLGYDPPRTYIRSMHGLWQQRGVYFGIFPLVF